MPFRDSPLYCEHANEVPVSCPCDSECYCRAPGHTCCNVAQTQAPLPLEEPARQSVWERLLEDD